MLFVLGFAHCKAQYPAFDTLYEPTINFNGVYGLISLVDDTLFCIGNTFIWNEENQYWQKHYQLKKLDLEGNEIENIFVADSFNGTGFWPALATGTSIYGLNDGQPLFPYIHTNYLFKFDMQLQQEWVWLAEPFLSDSSEAYLFAFFEQEDGDIMVTGEYRWNSQGEAIGISNFDSTSVGIARISESGETELTKNVWREGGPASKNCINIKELPDGTMFISGFQNTGWIGGTLFLLHVNEDGEVLHTKKWPAGDMCYEPRMVIKDNYAYIVYGYAPVDPDLTWGDVYDSDIRLSKFNYVTWLEEENTVVDCSAMAGSHWLVTVSSILLLDTDELVFVYFTQADNITPTPNHFFTKIDLAGNLIWEHAIPPPIDDQMYPTGWLKGLIQLPNGGFVLNGHFNYWIESIQKQWLIMTDPCGDIIYDGCPLDVAESALRYQPAVLYPNPTNSTINLSWQSTTQVAQLDIRNTLGMLVYSCPINGGFQQTVANTSSLAQGQYFVQLWHPDGFLLQTLPFVKE